MSPKKRCLGLAALSACLFVLACPSGQSRTFTFYIANLTPYPLQAFNMHDGDDPNLINVLEGPVPPHTLRVMELDTERFGDNFGEVSFQLQGGAGNSVSARIDDPPGEIGFILEDDAGVTEYRFFTVEGGAKAANLP